MKDSDNNDANRRRRVRIANKAVEYCSYLSVHGLVTDAEKHKIHRRIERKLDVIRRVAIRVRP